MTTDLNKRLDDVNRTLDSATNDAHIFESYANEYFDLLRQRLPELLDEIAEEDNQQKSLEILRALYPLQRHLMEIGIITKVSIDGDLWEIAEDFDNDDPKRYDYLLKRIKEKGYRIQDKGYER